MVYMPFFLWQPCVQIIPDMSVQRYFIHEYLQRPEESWLPLFYYNPVGLELAYYIVGGHGVVRLYEGQNVTLVSNISQNIDEPYVWEK